MTNRLLFTNNASTTLAADIASGATSVTVADGAAFAEPTDGDWQVLTITDGTNVEVVHLTARSGNTLTVTRGRESTSARAWDTGANISGRLTAEIAGGIATLSPSVTGNTALGSGAAALSNPETPAWAAITAYTIGDVVSIANTQQLLMCTRNGTSGASEPSGSNYAKVDDGSTSWVIVPSSTGQDFANTAIGYQSVSAGGQSVAIGHSASSAGTNATAVLGSAAGQGAVAVGSNSTAFGQYAVGIGWNANVQDDESVGLGNYLAVTGRDGSESVSIGRRVKYIPFKGAYTNQALPFVDHHDFFYYGAADDRETRNQHTREVTFYTIPIQAGDQTWQATTAYEHGQSVRPTTPNGFVYTAWNLNTGDYFGTVTSGSSEPTWPTTAGDTVNDGDTTWLCVDPTDIQFLIPDYTRFTPTSVGVIARSCTPGGSAAQPSFSFGINGDLDKWMAATQATKLTGDGASQFWEATNTESAKQFGAALTTAGTDIDCTVVLAVKGYIVESLSA